MGMTRDDGIDRQLEGEGAGGIAYRQAPPAIDAMRKAGAVPCVDGIMLPVERMEEYFGNGLEKCTTNPALFEQAITSTDHFDGVIGSCARSGMSPDQTLWDHLMIPPVVQVADRLRAAYESSYGMTGFVSLELHPDYARDVRRSLDQAHELIEKVGRPNLFIKVPATTEGLEVGRTLIGEGHHVNWTLIFTPEQMLEATRASLVPGRPETVRSVLSVFVSRPDRDVNAILGKENDLDPEAVALMQRMTPAIASAKLCYQAWTDEIGGTGLFEGSTPRLLWASLKANRAGDPLQYVSPLVGDYTVFTLPFETANALVAAPPDAIRRNAVLEDMELAREVVACAKETIGFQGILEGHVEAGCASFSKAFAKLRGSVEQKMTQSA